MADRKNPLFLRVMIVVVALLLGFSLNMFQFRNPFRSVGTDTADNAQLTERNRFPSRQETAPPSPPPAKPAMPEIPAPPASLGSPGSPDTGKPAPEKALADVPAPASPAAPQAVADASPAKPETKGEPVSIEVSNDSPALAPPKVTSDAAKAKAGKIGRQVATGVSGSLPEAKTVADASAPAQATSESAKGAPVPASGETGIPSAQAPQAEQPPQASSGDKAEQVAQTAKPGPEASAGASPSKASQPGSTGSVSSGQPSGAPVPQPSKAAQAAQSAGNGQRDRPAIALSSKTTQEQPGAPQAGAPSAPASPSEKTAAEVQPATPKGTRILEVKAQDKPGEFVLTIVTDGPVDRVTSFHAKGPARLAVDFQGSWQSALGASIPVEGELFERVRVGAHPDKLRLVIDYRDKELSAFSEQIVEKQPKGVVLRIPKAKPKP